MTFFDHLSGIEFRMANLIRINPQRLPVRRRIWTHSLQTLVPNQTHHAGILESHYYFSLAADLPVKAL